MKFVVVSTDCQALQHDVRYRARPGGPWQRLLPTVYLMATRQPTREQFETAALLYAGPASVITGATALRHYKIRAPRPTTGTQRCGATPG